MKAAKVMASIMVAIFFVSMPVANAVTWQAEWIWAKDGAAIPNSWAALRKDITLSEIDGEAIAYASADTKYWLWINGELVVFEGSYTGGPSPVKPAPRVDNFPIASHKYYDEIDIAPYLKEGENTIAVLAWYYGDNGTKGTHISTGQPGFLFQAQVGDQLIVSDASWKAKTHTAYQPAEKKPPFRVAAWSVNYDARKSMGDWGDSAWYRAGYDDSSWDAAKGGRKPPRAPFFNLFKSDVPPLNNFGLANCENYPEARFPFVSDGQTIKCNLDFNKNVTPYFDIESDEGLEISIRSNMKRNTIDSFYTTTSGRQQFESYSWMNARVLEFTIPAGVTVHGLKYRWTGVGEPRGHFESDDPWLTRIWQMSENTLYICARDNFMDTPDRERGLWIGDVADQASYLFYVMDQPGRDLLKKAITVTMAFSDSESGKFAGLGPGRFRELPAQSLQFIEQGVWHYYYNTGDLETLRYAYPYVHRYLALWETQENGLIVFRNGAWSWTDWGPQDTIDYDAIQNALYYSALVSARKMALELNDNTHLEFYDRRIEELKRAYQDQFWQDGFYSSDPETLKDDRANAIAILFGLAEPAQYQAIVDNVLVPNQFASPHFEWMVYQAMAKAGRYDDAISRMKQRYAKQVDNPALSTLAEYLPSGGTENHAWNAPATVLSQHIAGIEPTSIGWQTYQIMPNLAHLKYVKQLVPSVKGDIAFEMRRSDMEITMALDTPDDTTAMVGIPKEHFEIEEVRANGSVIWSGGLPSDEIARDKTTVKFAGADEKYIKFEVGPGDWALSAKGAPRSNAPD
ncbi:alpha-L-rhamnosidase C-terminal domain-containing protein [Pontixanthobacter rizhaonensis]|nr:alpha-L-rhamnosidase C-terminal domain-containing protein [Pontixanthobacter rizhaonensis]